MLIRKLRYQLPEEIQSYVTAFRLKKQIEDHNEELLLAGLAVLGGVTAISSSNSNISRVGIITVAGAAGVSAGKDIKASHDRLQYGYGKDHLLGKEVKIPGKFFTRKNILIEQSQGVSKASSIKICFEMPGVECLSVPFS